jgi:predicted transglutaminase-like protease
MDIFFNITLIIIGTLLVHGAGTFWSWFSPSYSKKTEKKITIIADLIFVIIMVKSFFFN